MAIIRNDKKQCSWKADGIRDSKKMETWAQKCVEEKYKEYFMGFSMAIAFDRYGTHSIITYQLGKRTCSDEFAQKLAKQLSDDKYQLEPDPTGVFTDTFEFKKLIPECTNISTGYQNAHRKNEFLDYQYLIWLKGKIINIFT